MVFLLFICSNFMYWKLKGYFLGHSKLNKYFSKTDLKKFREKAQRTNTGFSIMPLKQLSEKKNPFSLHYFQLLS